MNHITSVGLDVHARSIKACAFNPLTGEVQHRSFAYAPAEVAEWILSLDAPKAVYESGVAGFHLQRQLEAEVRAHSEEPRWKPAVDALCCLKGIDAVTAFALAAETDGLSRFRSAPAYASWLGIVPSEHSSGDSRHRGGITRSGNKHLRKLLIEASWHCIGASRHEKALRKGQEVAPEVRRHAAKGVKRLVDRRAALLGAGKKPVVANCATARELACWAWAIGRMVEAA